MIAFALLVVGVAFATACWRVGTLLALAVRPMGDRWLSVQERKIALEEAARAPRPKAKPMPPDLRNRIGMLDEGWAQEDEERTLFALYAEYDDWDIVRQQLRPLAPITDPMSVDRPFADPFGG